MMYFVCSLLVTADEAVCAIYVGIHLKGTQLTRELSSLDICIPCIPKASDVSLSG